MTKTEFIRECAMRNLAAMFAGGAYWDTTSTNGVEQAYQAAVNLADIVYRQEEKK